MNGNLLIDGVDVFQQFGIIVLQDSYNNLLQYPSIKKIDYNDWHEENGIQPDLSEIAIDTKTVSIKFASTKGKTSDFINFITNSAYHTFDFTDLETYTLRLNNQSNLSIIRTLEVFMLSFNDDFWNRVVNILATNNGSAITTNGGSIIVCGGLENTPAQATTTQPYELDGVNFGDYGVCILQGTKKDVLKMPDVKQNLTRSFQKINGVFYDDVNVTFQSRK